MSERVPSGIPQSQGVGIDPLTRYTRLFCRFLQIIFSDFEKGSYHWDVDTQSTDIIISDQSTLSLDAMEKRPAIIVSRGALAFTNVSIDQFAGPLLDKQINGQERFTPNLNINTGSERHTDLVSGTIVYNCLSREGIEAQRLAWMSGGYTRTLKKVLIRAGLHRVGENIQYSAESAPGSIVQPDSNEIVMVSVSIPFYFQDTWNVEPEDKLLLKHVDMALRSEVEAATPSAVIKEPSIYGRVLNCNTAVSLGKVSTGPLRPPKPRRL